MGPVAVPAWVGYAALGASVAGTAVAVKAQMDNARFQSRMADYNEKVAEQQAVVEREQGSAQAADLRDRMRRTIADQRVALANAGVTLDSGSPLALLGDTAAEGALDQEQAKWNGEMRARGYDIEGVSQRLRGKMAESAGAYGAAGSLLTGASNAFQMGLSSGTLTLKKK
ncbi:MAG: hypothetical protein ABFD84_14535 [Candidatus Polarisedimenticolia bacterium]|nr:hypothetical protein [bacterium]